MKVVIIVQARMTSTRLPGKVLRRVLDKPLLGFLIERLQRAQTADDIVIATTVNRTDDPIVDLCKQMSIHHYRGPEDDVLARYHAAASAFHADVIVRVTSDCPVIDPEVIDRVARFFKEHPGAYDYVSNTQIRTYPRGMDTEVFSFAVLNEAFYEAAKPAEREHVTPFIYTNPHRYRIAGITYHEDQSRHRWTVDTDEDFELVKRIFEALYPKNPVFSLQDILDLIGLNPDWMKINAYVEQKKLGASC